MTVLKNSRMPLSQISNIVLLPLFGDWAGPLILFRRTTTQQIWGKMGNPMKRSERTKRIIMRLDQEHKISNFFFFPFF